MGRCNICGLEHDNGATINIDRDFGYEAGELDGLSFRVSLCQKHNLELQKLGLEYNGFIPEEQWGIFTIQDGYVYTCVHIEHLLSKCSIVPEGYYDGGYVLYTDQECQMMWGTKQSILELVEYPRFIELADVFGEGEVSHIFQRRFPIEYADYKKEKEYGRAVHYAVLKDQFYAYERETGDKFESKNYHSLSEFFSTFENSRYIIAQVH